MKREFLAVLVVLGLAAPLLADDAADAAEARRRGVPVVQVQAEKALAAEKQKTAELEKKLSDLKQKYADMEAQAKAAASRGPAPRDKGKDEAAVYKDFVKRYLVGDWEKLGADLAARKNEIDAMAADKAADLAYIQQAVADGRPAWWDAIKAGKGSPHQAEVWKHTISFSFYNGAPRFVPPNGNLPFSLGWPTGTMDSFDVMSMEEVQLAVPANFRKGDGAGLRIWDTLGLADAYQTAGADKVRQFGPADKARFTVYSAFWSDVTAGYYGTPWTRRLLMIEALASFEEVNDTRPDWLAKRPIGAAVLLEMHRNKDLYKSVHVETIIGLSQAAKSGHEYELFLAKPIVLGMANSKLTFEEDKSFREMFKELAEKNTSWNVSKLALPNDLSYDLNIEADLPLSDERRKFLEQK